MDFGLSKLVKLGERTGTICGTLQYMGKDEFHKTLNKTLTGYITTIEKRKTPARKKCFSQYAPSTDYFMYPFFVICSLDLLKLKKIKGVIRILLVRGFKIIHWDIYIFTADQLAQ